MWVNDAQTLWVDRNKDTWQLPVFSCDGIYCGNVVSQIVEPSECLVRYFIVLSRTQKRLFVLPSESVFSLGKTMQCVHVANILHRLPTYKQKISRELEEEVQELLAGSQA